MNDDSLFRWVLVGAFAVFMPIGIYHRLKSRTGEKLDRRQEGLFILVTLRLAGVSGLVGWVTYIFNPDGLAWAAAPMPRWLRWAGLGLVIIAGMLLAWMFRTLGRNLTDTVVTRKQHRLVTTGPYRWVRHPFYSSAALLIIGTFLVAANWFFLAAGGLMMLLLVVRTRKEEENLVARFGEDYRNYMRRTGRFVPRWGTCQNDL